MRSSRLTPYCLTFLKHSTMSPPMAATQAEALWGRGEHPELDRRLPVYQYSSDHHRRLKVITLSIYVSCPSRQQNLGRRFGASKMHLSPPVAWAAVRSKAVVLLLLTFCLLLLPLWESVIVLCIVVRCFMFILVLQSS